MSQIWLSAEQVIELGYSRPTLFRHLKKLVTRSGPKAANGRHQKEIALESLPPDVQARYFSAVRREGLGVRGEEVEGERQQESETNSPHSTGETEGNAGASRAGAADHLPAAPPSHRERIFTTKDTKGTKVENPLADMSEAEIDTLTIYAETLRRADGKSPKQRRWIAKKAGGVGGVSLSTLDRDLAAFRAGGLAALARKVRADAGASRVADAKVIARIQAEFLKTHRPTAARVHKIIAKDFTLSGLRPPSYSFVRRIVGAIAPDLVARFRIGEREHNAKFAYYTEREKPPLPRQWVDADHHECDHYVRFPDGSTGRPWLTAFQDICTNEILGFNIPRDKKVGDGAYPGSESIALALRRAILKKDTTAWPSYGLFEHLYHDLGKDYRSPHVRAVCAALNIEVVRTRGYHGQSKPIERWFGIMEDGLKHLPGYCGNKPENNPARQKIKPEPIDPKKLLSLDEFEAALGAWIVGEFHHAASRALKGLSPIEALAAHVKHGFSAREVRDDHALDLLLMRRKGKPVQRKGIAMFGSAGSQRYFLAPELLDLVGQEVEVSWDPAAIGEVLIYKDNRFVCKAANAELLRFGASEEMLERERELKRHQKRRLNERYDEILQQAQYTNPLERAAAEERYEKVMGEERQKIAVNAEADSIPQLLPKFQQASKALRRQRSALRPVKKQSQISDLKSHPSTGSGLTAEETPDWMIPEPLKTGEEIFKREKDPEWLEEDET